MKIIAWNINGLKSLLKTSYLNELLDLENPDILCIGETKLSCDPIIDSELFCISAIKLITIIKVI